MKNWAPLSIYFHLYLATYKRIKDSGELHSPSHHTINCKNVCRLDRNSRHSRTLSWLKICVETFVKFSILNSLCICQKSFFPFSCFSYNICACERQTEFISIQNPKVLFGLWFYAGFFFISLTFSQYSDNSTLFGKVCEHGISTKTVWTLFIPFFFASLKLENKFYLDKRTSTLIPKRFHLKKKNQNNVSIATLVQGADPYCQGVE